MRMLSVLSSLAVTFALATGAQAQMSIGLGAAMFPQFEGSADYRFMPTPTVSF
jgi:outer membrane scaffolding protein for murein synthesis (MipA/OmpV family)